MSRRLITPLLAVLALALAGAGATGAATTRVVMSGLDNPRGLAFGPEGALYVAEAGRGGAGPCFNPPIRGGTMCYGATGAISRLWRGEQSRIASGLPSYANILTGEAAGPHDISFLGRGHAQVTIGWAGEGLPRSVLPVVGEQFGRLLQFSASGNWHEVADLTGYEFLTNPDRGILDSNPYGLLAEPGSAVVTDAGGNSLLRVRANGDIFTIATFPSRTSGRSTDAVPTAVVAAPGGAYYVSELTGVPFAAGAANIYRVVPGQAPTIAYSGFTTVLDLAVGPDGSLYVLEHSTGPVFFALPGRLTKIAPDGTRSTVIAGLTRPTSVAVSPDGDIYVFHRGNAIGVGEVLQIQP